MRAHLTISFLLLLVAIPQTVIAQSVPAVTVGDYARAEQFLAQNTSPLVSGTPGRVTWRQDGRAWYQVSTATGSQFIMVDPAAGSRERAFDHERLARALSDASGQPVEAATSFRRFAISTDANELTGRIAAGSWTCDFEVYTCAGSSGVEEGERQDPPRNSVISPDESTAVFIRDHNLWAYDLMTGDETQLTTDGVEDFGYGTNNAGWVRRDAPVVTWSPEGAESACSTSYARRSVSRNSKRGVIHCQATA